MTYGEDCRRESQITAGVTPEGPHNTTEVISAEIDYHRLRRNAWDIERMRKW
jgi:hypothetical protein